MRRNPQSSIAGEMVLLVLPGVPHPLVSPPPAFRLCSFFLSHFYNTFSLFWCNFFPVLSPGRSDQLCMSRSIIHLLLTPLLTQVVFLCDRTRAVAAHIADLRATYTVRYRGNNGRVIPLYSRPNPVSKKKKKKWKWNSALCASVVMIRVSLRMQKTPC